MQNFKDSCEISAANWIIIILNQSELDMTVNRVKKNQKLLAKFTSYSICRKMKHRSTKLELIYHNFYTFRKIHESFENANLAGNWQDSLIFISAVICVTRSMHSSIDRDFWFLRSLQYTMCVILWQLTGVNWRASLKISHAANRLDIAHNFIIMFSSLLKAHSNFMNHAII